jgi:hypothetical protein
MQVPQAHVRWPRFIRLGFPTMVRNIVALTAMAIGLSPTIRAADPVLMLACHYALKCRATAMRYVLALAAALIPLALASPAPAANIWATGTNVVITGKIEANDYAVFVDTVLPETKTVYLNSPGGYLAPALKIAIMVKEREYETVVENYGVCASACAVIWLSGNVRRMLPGSRIGLHSARAKEDPTSTRSDFGTTQMTRTYLKIV